MEIKNLYDKVKKPILYGSIAAATITGTFGGNEGGLTPIYNRKVGTSFGINISGYTEFAPGSEFYGINFSGLTINSGIINGANFNILACGSNNGCINGLEAGILLNTSKDNIRDLEQSAEVNGLQAAILANGAKAGNVIQVGGWNESLKENGEIKRSLLLNYHFKGRSRK